jgi:hypothetical protein
VSAKNLCHSKSLAIGMEIAVGQPVPRLFGTLKKEGNVK